MPGQYDFTIDQGALIQKTIQWLDANKQPVNITGYHASLVIYNPYTLASILTLIDTGTSPGLVISGTSGIVQATITVAQSTLLTFDFAKYYLKLTYSTTIAKFLLEGWITNRRR